MPAAPAAADSKIVPPSWREFLRFWAPVVVASAVVLIVAWQYVEPAPPGKVVIATGPAGSTYNDYARKYQDYFAAHGVELEVRETSGAAQNYALLNDPDSGVDVALVQGGTAPPAHLRKNVEGVCTVSVEPLFICYRHVDDPIGPVLADPTTINDLAGRRLAIGSKAGGTRAVAEPLLRAHGVLDAPGTTIVDESGPKSAAKLKAGEIDVSFFAVDAQTPYLLDLLQTPGIRLLSLRNADVYTHKFAYVTPTTLDEGIIDLRANVPDHPVRTLAVSTALVARKKTHKAVVQLLVQAAHDTHAGMHPVAARNAFPSLELGEVPIGADARYYFNLKPGFLQRKIPFWAAQLVDRLLILIVPLLVVLIPMMRLAPVLYRWGVQHRIYRWYRRLRVLDDRAMADDASPSQREIDLTEVQKLDREVSAVRVPLSYMEQLYQLRLHIAWVKDRLAGVVGATTVQT